MLTLLVATTLFLPSKDASFGGGAFRAEDDSIVLEGDTTLEGKSGPRGEERSFSFYIPRIAVIAWKTTLKPGGLTLKLPKFREHWKYEVALQDGKTWLPIGQSSNEDLLNRSVVIRTEGTYRIKVRTEYVGVGSKKIEGLELSGSAIVEPKQ